jgi:hypothetical protein
MKKQTTSRKVFLIGYWAVTAACIVSFVIALCGVIFEQPWATRERIWTSYPLIVAAVCGLLSAIGLAVLTRPRRSRTAEK